jgi:hypothetical protein
LESNFNKKEQVYSYNFSCLSNKRGELKVELHKFSTLLNNNKSEITRVLASFNIKAFKDPFNELHKLAMNYKLQEKNIKKLNEDNAELSKQRKELSTNNNDKWVKTIKVLPQYNGTSNCGVFYYCICSIVFTGIIVFYLVYDPDCPKVPPF